MDMQRHCLTTILAGTVSVFALANSAAAQSMAANVPTEQVTVTGTRISGTDTPTPVQVQTADQLEAITPASIPEALDKSPIFMGGSTPENATTGANGRGNNAPGFFLNLRNLGTIRTLVLEDGHRVPGTFYDTTVDTSMLPQMLVQRVEVVTGGASAVYGSDAVSGVVNFILDHKFEGLKGEFEGGESNYGDTRSFRAGLAGGEDVLGGHLIWSIEYRDRDALPNAASRPLGNQGYSVVGAGTTANPYYLVNNIRQANTAPGGLITSTNSPGYGMQFLNNGNLGAFNPGTPTVTTNFDIGGDGGIEHNEYLLPVVNNAQFFGHYDYDFSSGITGWVEARYALSRTYEAGQIFTDTAGGNTLTGSCTPVNGVCTGNPAVNFTNNGSGAQYPITIYSGNPFLTAAEQSFLFPGAAASCQSGASFVPTSSTTACPSFIMNRMDNDLMSRLSLDQHTGALQVSAGLKGSLFDKYDWDFTYSHGETRNQLTTRNNVDTAKFYAALDAVRDPSTGNVVCNVSLTAPGAFPGCVPLNLFGQSGSIVNGSNASQAALNYVGDTTYWTAHNGLDDFSANIDGTIFDDWAGPVKAAVGVEYRLASLNVYTSNPSNTFNPQYLRLAPPGTFCPTPGSLASCTTALAAGTPLASPTGAFPASNLSEFKEVQSGARASENVSEANFELDAPLLKGLPLVELLSVNAAGRYTQYNVGGLDPTSTSGATKNSSFSASTWKIGAEWQITDDIKARASRSRDIRAPTLWDLYQGPVTTTSGVLDPLTNVSGSVNTSQIGNPNLKPEVARNTTAGLVFTPTFLPGFSATVDYYHIVIANEIAAVSGNNQTVLNICESSGGSSPLCNLIVRPGAYNNTSPTNFPILYLSAPQNTQTAWSEGYDIEANYQNDISEWSGLAGTVGMHLMWSHTSLLKSVLTLPGSVISDVAGAANAPGAALPRDKAAMTLSYLLDGIGVNFQERYYSPIRQNANPTLVFNIPNISAYFISDLNVSYNFSAWGTDSQVFLNVQNLFDRSPDILQVPGYTGSPGMNYPVVPYEDLIGRYYTMGFRFKM
jgi:outer membrane receptor protein involved in Fe transport